jgi:hypothetical protein
MYAFRLLRVVRCSGKCPSDQEPIRVCVVQCATLRSGLRLPTAVARGIPMAPLTHRLHTAERVRSPRPQAVDPPCAPQRSSAPTRVMRAYLHCALALTASPPVDIVSKSHILSPLFVCQTAPPRYWFLFSRETTAPLATSRLRPRRCRDLGR